MLLEFTTSRVNGGGQAHILVSQITDLSQAHDGDEIVVGLRSGRAIYVKESMEDILDALSYVTRHISTSPGIVDKIDGEHEEVYPWRRRERVKALAEKWRAHVQTTQAGAANMSRPAPVYTRTTIPPNPRPPWLEPVLVQPLLNPPPLTAPEDAKFQEAVDNALVELSRDEQRPRESEAERYDRLEREHLGDPDLKTGIYAEKPKQVKLTPEQMDRLRSARQFVNLREVPSPRPAPRPMTDADRHALTQDELETLPTGERAALVQEYLKRENIDPALPPLPPPSPVAQEAAKVLQALDDALAAPSVGHGRHQEPPVAAPPEFPEDLNDPRR